ncbi:hypothetical protein KIPB_011715, partial [Kipferlia bialata]
AAVTSLRAELARERKRELAAFRPECIEQYKASIEQAKAFLAQTLPLESHLSRVGSYLPVAEGISASTSALEECLEEHPIEKLVTEECASVFESLGPLMEQFHAHFEAMRNLDFEPAESLKYMQPESLHRSEYYM